jgi:hypothetical protein
MRITGERGPLEVNITLNEAEFVALYRLANGAALGERQAGTIKNIFSELFQVKTRHSIQTDFTA